MFQMGMRLHAILGKVAAKFPIGNKIGKKELPITAVEPKGTKKHRP